MLTFALRYLAATAVITATLATFPTGRNWLVLGMQISAISIVALTGLLIWDEIVWHQRTRIDQALRLFSQPGWPKAMAQAALVGTVAFALIWLALGVTP